MKEIIRQKRIQNLTNSLKIFLQKIKLKAKMLVKKQVEILINILPANFKEKVRQTPVYHEHFKPSRSQRVYLKNGLGPLEFLKILNGREIEYVLLRWWEHIPYYPKGEDLNILVIDEHRDLINDLVSIFDQKGRKCDLYTVRGTKNGCRINVPVFSQNLSKELLGTRVFFKGAFVPAPIPYFASVAYHAIFHKGYNSGIPGFKKKPTKYVYNYKEFLENMALELKLEVDITVKGLFNWLTEKGYAPAPDTLTKLAENKPEISFLESPLFSDIRGGELMTFVIRERLLTDGFLDDFQNYLYEEYQFDILDIRILSNKEKEICSSQIRGGKWDKGPWKESGGLPVALVTAFDYHPVPFNVEQQKKQPRITNSHTVKAKYGYRKRLSGLRRNKGEYNGLHSADNEPDAWFYISLLGNEYKAEIFKQVEIIRERYGVKWGVVKLLSKGPVSKVELIKYNMGLAVKKTFRPGKERFLKRELYCTKELSKELTFIPQLLEEGDGFLIIPFIENILESLDFNIRKNKIYCKKQEIFRIITEMYKRKLSFINFNPQSILITPNDELFCTGYSYVQKYKSRPKSLNGAYEITGLPQDFEGDLPPGLKISASSFQDVWKLYLGVEKFWKQKFFQNEKLFPKVSYLYKDNIETL